MSCWKGCWSGRMIALYCLLASPLLVSTPIGQNPKPDALPSAIPVAAPVVSRDQEVKKDPTASPKPVPAKSDSPESLRDPATGTWKDPNKQPEYRVGVGDTLQIIVWKEPEVSGDVQIRGDCRITIQLIKDLEVCNFTPTEIQDLVADRLSTFYQITVADVTVVLRSLSSRKVYFLGAVKRPGGMVLNGPITIAQALNDAGGLAEFANDKKVVIMRMKEGKWVRYVFNYRNYIHGKSTEGNMLLEPGDQIIVK